jgi:undecaprenyl diphosphate synthase
MSKSSALNHLGLIVDGNRRWAAQQGIPQLEGHRKGFNNLVKIGIAAHERGIHYVTAYVFSTENWNRSKEEVSYLMDLLIFVTKNKINELHKKNIKLLVIGGREGVDQKVLDAIDSATEKTKNNTDGVLTLCFNYGGHQEIVDTMNKIITQNGGKKTSVKEFAANLYAPDIPDLDLIIRSSGEQRLSNFMLWRAAYSELLFVDKCWPAFTESDLGEAIEEYNQRQRRFGK